MKERVTVFMMDTYVLKPEKVSEYATFLKRYDTWMRSQPELFREVKSVRLYSQTLGHVLDSYCEIWEFESLAGLETWVAKYFVNKEATAWHQEWLGMVVPGTESRSTLRPIFEYTH